MLKKLLTLSFGLVLAFGISAQTAPKSVSISQDNVEFWVGSGSNSTLICIGWDYDMASYTPTVVVWGVHWNGSITLLDALDSLTTYDSRFTYTVNGTYLNTVNYHDTENGVHLTPCMYFNCNNYGGVYGSTALGTTWLRISESTCSDYNFSTVNNLIYASNPNAVGDTTTIGDTITVVDASIDADDILFWVGHGNNEVVMAINWADSALAWGYRFDTDSVVVGDMVEDIVSADPRLSIIGSAGFISDFLYADSSMTDTLRLTPHDINDYNIYFNMSVNHQPSMLGAALHKVANGDFVKFADTYVAVKVDSTWVSDWGGYWDYTYVWPMTIHPVTVLDTATGPSDPEPEHGPFCGAVGTEGCNAIPADSSVIVAWATGVHLQRGPVNISNPDSPSASFGDENNVIGMATLNNTMEAVSLGDGGSAIVTFACPIINGEGPDFAVYENGFSDFSLELAFVEVSTDGERFVRFPATCLTQTETQLGNTGQSDPTNINNLAGKFRIGYGTPFDLEELVDSTGIDIDSIVYVRIVDVVGCIDPQYATYDAFGHIINDPWPTPFNTSGFDLTGVAVINQRPETQGISASTDLLQTLWPNPAINSINVIAAQSVTACLYDWSGRLVSTFSLKQGHNSIPLQNLASGVYILRAEGSVAKIVKR